MFGGSRRRLLVSQTGRSMLRHHKGRSTRKVQRRGRRALWTDAGSGALGVGGGDEGRCGNAATLDAGGGVVESRAEARSASAVARAQGALWGVGADGRELSRMARGARSGGLFDGPGG